MEVEDEVKFTNVTEIFIQNLHEALHEFQDNKLIFIFVDDGDKIQTGVTFVDDFVLLVVKEIAHFGVACDY